MKEQIVPRKTKIKANVVGDICVTYCISYVTTKVSSVINLCHCEPIPNLPPPRQIVMAVSV